MVLRPQGAGSPWSISTTDPGINVEYVSVVFHLAFYFLFFNFQIVSVPFFGQILIKMFIVKLYILSMMGLSTSQLGFYIRVFSHSKKYLIIKSKYL